MVPSDWVDVLVSGLAGIYAIVMIIVQVGVSYDNTI